MSLIHALFIADNVIVFYVLTRFFPALKLFFIVWPCLQYYENNLLLSFLSFKLVRWVK